MRARDVFKEFYMTSFSVPPDSKMREGVFCGVYDGALLQREKGKPPAMFTLPYYSPSEVRQNFNKPAAPEPPMLHQMVHDMLVWCVDQGIPVFLPDKNPDKARADLRAAGADERLIANVIDFDEAFVGPDLPLEVVISGDFVIVQSHIYIEPERSKFTRFMASMRYKNPGITGPTELPGPTEP